MVVTLLSDRGHTSPSDAKGNGGRREILPDCLVSGIQVTTALVCGLYNNICVGFPRIEQPAPSGATLERLRAELEPQRGGMRRESSAGDF